MGLLCRWALASLSFNVFYVAGKVSSSNASSSSEMKAALVSAWM